MYIKDFKKNKDNNDAITLEEVFQLLKDQKYMTSYQKNFDSIISKFEPNSEGRKLKYNSKVCATIMSCKRFFEYNNIRVDLVLKACKTIFYDARRSKHLIKLSTRPICYRCQISFLQLKIILDVLERFDFIKLKYINGEPYISLNVNFKNDCWVRDLSKRFIKITESAYLKCRNDGIGLYFYAKSSKIIKRNNKQSIIDITLAYNEMYPVIGDTDNGVAYNRRADICYLEVPVNLIASMNNMSINDVKKTLYYMCSKTDIIARHDKVYVDNDMSKHYVNDRYYFDCGVEDRKNVELEEGHPPVTENSIILFWKPFKDSKYYKKYLKNKSKIENDIVRYVKVRGIDLDISEDDYEEPFDETAFINNLSEKLSKQMDENNEDDVREASALGLFDPEHTTGHIISQKSLQYCKDVTEKPYILTKNKIDNMKIPELVYALIKTLRNLPHIGNNALKHQKQQVEYIIKKIPEVLFDLSYHEPNNARYWKEVIENYSNNECKKDVCLPYIKIDLPLTEQEKREQLVNYLESIEV